MTALPSNASKANMDATGDSPLLARADLASLVDKFNDVIAFLTALLGTDGTTATGRSTLGVQAVHANLTALAGLTGAADKLAYFTGSGAMSLTTLSSFVRTLLDDADAATARATLGVTGAAFSDQIGFNGNTTLATSDLNKSYFYYGSGGHTATLPVPTGAQDGSFTRIQNESGYKLTLARQTSGTIYYADGKSGTSVIIPPGYTAEICGDGGDWHVHISPPVRGANTAWIYFNGTGTPAIRDSYNISSITDNGVGDYTLNFQTAMSNTNFAVIGGCVGDDAATKTIVTGPSTTSRNASWTRIGLQNWVSGAVDMAHINVAVMGGH